MNTTQTSDFTGLPGGWSTPSGGGLHLVTHAEVDALGRTTKLTRPTGAIDYTVYDDPDHEARSYLGWNSATGLPTGPTLVMREDRANGYTESLTMTATPHLTSGRNGAHSSRLPAWHVSLGSLISGARRSASPRERVIAHS